MFFEVTHISNLSETTYFIQADSNIDAIINSLHKFGVNSKDVTSIHCKEIKGIKADKFSRKRRQKHYY